MKAINRHIILTAIFSLTMMAGCKKPYDYDKETTPAYSVEKLAERINGKWALSSAIHIDELSVTKESVDITDFYTQDGAAAPNVTFDYVNKTFSVDTAGVQFNYFKVKEGKWTFDNERYPSSINLTDADNNALGSIQIGSSLLGPTPKLNYVSGAECDGGTKVMSFNIIFTKSN